MRCRNLVPAVLLAVLAVPLTAAGQPLEPLEPCADCDTRGWPVRLLPGDIRMALPSPDGTMLAILGGPGVEGREHTVLVVERTCDGSPPRAAVLSGSAPFPEVPAKVPAPFVRLTWSPDSRWLYAAGGVYRFDRSRDGAVKATRVREVADPYFDLRMGTAGKAVGVRMTDARRRKVRTDGEEAFAVTLRYEVVMLTRDAEMEVKPRDRASLTWIPLEWDGPPAVQWEPDGSMLLFYPYLETVERVLPGRIHDGVEGLRPDPWVAPGTGPFEFEEPCPARWRLVSDDRADRVVLDE